MFGSYIEEFNCTLEEAIQFSGVSILVLGFSNFLWSAAIRCKLLFAVLTDQGYHCRPRMGDVLLCLLPSSSILLQRSGEPEHKHMAASWERQRNKHTMNLCLIAANRLTSLNGFAAGPAETIQPAVIAGMSLTTS